jgi:hypothetical protein
MRSAKGCRLCAKGAKMVLFVTGLCDRDCFYCPLSEKRSKKDVIYANERPVYSDKDVLDEVIKMSALGTGITGGEPLIVLDRTLYYIRFLKREFGERHHIHLYTTRVIDKKIADGLSSGGLDEIRFHVLDKPIKYKDGISYLKNAGISVGVEMPLVPLPYMEQRIGEVIECLDIDFLNLNELEFSETNYEQMQKMQIETDNGISAKKSTELAYRIMDKYKRKIPINFCTAAFKDGIQLRRRLIRTAKNTAKSYESITEDGTIVRGVIEGDIKDIENTLEGLPFEEVDGKIYMNAYLLKRVASLFADKNVTAYISEVYPTWDALEVEREYITGYIEE